KLQIRMSKWNSADRILEAKIELKRRDSGEEDAFGRARFLVRIVMGPPLLPSLRVVAQRFAGDESKRAVNPAARIRVQRIIIEKIQQIGHGGKTLLVREHSRLGDADSGALAHTRRRIMRETIQQRINRAICAKHCEAFYGPETSLLVAVAREGEQVGEHKFRLHAPIAPRAQSPQPQ